MIREWRGSRALDTGEDWSRVEFLARCGEARAVAALGDGLDDRGDHVRGVVVGRIADAAKSRRRPSRKAFHIA